MHLGCAFVGFRKKIVLGPTFKDRCAHNFAKTWNFAPVWLVDGPILALNDVNFAKTRDIWYHWEWYSFQVDILNTVKVIEHSNVEIYPKFWVYFAVVLKMCTDLSSLSNLYKTTHSSHNIQVKKNILNNSNKFWHLLLVQYYYNWSK